MSPLTQCYQGRRDLLQGPILSLTPGSRVSQHKAQQAGRTLKSPLMLMYKPNIPSGVQYIFSTMSQWTENKSSVNSARCSSSKMPRMSLLQPLTCECLTYDKTSHFMSLLWKLAFPSIV